MGVACASCRSAKPSQEFVELAGGLEPLAHLLHLGVGAVATLVPKLGVGVPVLEAPVLSSHAVEAVGGVLGGGVVLHDVS